MIKITAMGQIDGPGKRMVNRRHYTLGMLWLCGLLVPAWALAEEKLSDISFYYTQDDNQARDRAILLNLGVSQDDTLSFTFGDSSSDYTFTTRTGNTFSGELTTDQYSLGYSTLRIVPWILSASYEYWGKSNELEISSYRFSADYFFEKWVAGVNFQYRQIDVYSRNLMTSGSVTADSLGLGLNIERDWEAWRWSVFADGYDYDDTINNLTTLDLIRLVGLRNYSHTSALVDWSAGSRLSYQIDQSRLSAQYTHSVATIGDTDVDTFAMIMDTTIQDTYLLNLEVGQSQSLRGSEEVKTSYFSIGAGIKF